MNNISNRWYEIAASASNASKSSCRKLRIYACFLPINAFSSGSMHFRTLVKIYVANFAICLGKRLFVIWKRTLYNFQMHLLKIWIARPGQILFAEVSRDCGSASRRGTRFLWHLCTSSSILDGFFVVLSKPGPFSATAVDFPASSLDL